MLFAWRRSWGRVRRTRAGLAAAKAAQSFYEFAPEVVNHFLVFSHTHTI